MSPTRFAIFSEHEKLVIDIIGRRKMTIADITSEFYKQTQDDEPFEPNNHIAGVIRRIVKKCEHHKMTWTLEGEGTGRGGRTVWRAPRADKKA